MLLPERRVLLASVLWTVLWMVLSGPGDAFRDTTNGGGQLHQAAVESFAKHIARKLLQTRGASKFIAGGEDAALGRHPYACSLRKMGSREHACGGVLIDKKWVLTAAHCVSGPDSLGPTPIVYVGGLGLNDESNAETFRALGSIVHERWTGNTDDGYDIALVELKEESIKAPLTMVGTGQSLGVGQFLAAIGWGRTSTRKLGSTLQVAKNLEFISPVNCKRLWPQLKNDMICAYSSQQAACHGDSGGPLIILDEGGNPSFDTLVGIVSFGPQDCGTTSAGKYEPGVYASISFFRAWIDGKMTGKATPAAAPPDTSVSPVAPPPATGPASPGAFLTAAAEGDLATVQSQIANGVGIETKGERERTALLTAAFKGHAEVVSWLLQNGADISATDDNGFTAVVLAAYQGFGEVVKVLAARGADLEAKSGEGVPAIFYAAERNHAGAVGVLLDGGADIEAFRRGGATALMIAAQEGNKNVVLELISRGANVNVKNGVMKSAMHSAAQGPDNAELIFALLDAGAEIDSKDKDGNIPLHYASLSGRKSNIEALLSRGSDPTTLNVDGDSPADDACKCLTSANSVCNTEFCQNSRDEIVAALG